MFLNPLLLGGLALASVPVLIHLLSKSRFKPVKWAAMEFLLRALAQNSRRLQIRDLILMLLRAAAVASLALALARPALSGRTGVLGGQQTPLAVFLIDNSMSMSCRSGRETRLAAARRLAKTVLAQLEKNAYCAVLTFNTDCRAPLGDPSQNHAFVEQELERAVLQSDGATNLEKALRRAQELFQQPQFRAARKDLYLFTDLQAAGWSRRRTSETFPELLRDLSRQAVVCIVDAGDAARENVALVELEPSDLLATAEMPISVTAQVRNFGLTDQAGVPVELYVDPGGSAEDRPADRITLNLEAGKTAAAEFKVRLPSGGDHRLEARIGEDRLAADNRRGCVVEVVEELRFLLVEGRGREGGRPGEAEFLRAALSPVDPDNPEKQSVIVSETIPPYRLAEKDLSNYQALALCNLERLSVAEAAAVARQVRSGMGLFIFLGDRTDAAAFNQVLGPSGAGLLPAALTAPWGEAPKLEDRDLPAHTFLAQGPGKLAHPLTAEFNQDEFRSLLDQVRFHRAFGLSAWAEKGAASLEKAGSGAAPEPEAVVAASFINGETAMMERRCGAGLVILVPFPATTAWSNWATQPVFVILMQRAAARLAMAQRPARNLSAGAPLRGRLSLSDQRTTVLLIPPYPLPKQELKPELAGEEVFFECSRTETAGFYEATLNRPGSPSRWYAVNPDARAESDLSSLTAEQLRAEYPGFEFFYVAKNEDLALRLVNQKHGVEVWPWFLALVFLFLAAESVLTRRWAPRA